MNALSYSRAALVLAYVVLVLSNDGGWYGWYLVGLGAGMTVHLSLAALKMAREHAAETMRGGA